MNFDSIDLQEVVGGLRCRGSLISRIWKSTKNNINFKINLCVNQSMWLMDQYIYIYWLSHNAFKNHNFIILFNLTKLADIKREKHYKIRFDIRRYDKCARLLEAASHKDKSIHRGSISCVSNSVDSLWISLTRISSGQWLNKHDVLHGTIDPPVVTFHNSYYYYYCYYYYNCRRYKPSLVR